MHALKRTRIFKGWNAPGFSRVNYFEKKSMIFIADSKSQSKNISEWFKMPKNPEGTFPVMRFKSLH